MSGREKMMKWNLSEKKPVRSGREKFEKYVPELWYLIDFIIIFNNVARNKWVVFMKIDHG